MGKRLELQSILEIVLNSRNVYFQPPETIKLNYPCIIYNRSTDDTKFANNKKYLNKSRYQATVIDSNPDSVIPDRLSELQYCIFDRQYTANNLNHFVYNIYI